MLGKFTFFFIISIVLAQDCCSLPPESCVDGDGFGLPLCSSSAPTTEIIDNSGAAPTSTTPAVEPEPFPNVESADPTSAPPDVEPEPFPNVGSATPTDTFSITIAPPISTDGTATTASLPADQANEGVMVTTTQVPPPPVAATDVPKPATIHNPSPEPNLPSPTTTSSATVATIFNNPPALISIVSVLSTTQFTESALAATSLRSPSQISAAEGQTSNSIIVQPTSTINSPTSLSQFSTSYRPSKVSTASPASTSIVPSGSPVSTDGSLSKGTIAGIGIGLPIAACVAGACLYSIIKRRVRNRSEAREPLSGIPDEIESYHKPETARESTVTELDTGESYPKPKNVRESAMMELETIHPGKLVHGMVPATGKGVHEMSSTEKVHEM